MSQMLLYCTQTSLGGKWEGQCQILSGVEPFWLIATVRGGEYFKLPEFISTQKKV